MKALNFAYTLKLPAPDAVLELVGIENNLVDEDDDLGSIGEIVDVDQMSDSSPPIFPLAEDVGTTLDD